MGQIQKTNSFVSLQTRKGSHLSYQNSIAESRNRDMEARHNCRSLSSMGSSARSDDDWDRADIPSPKD